MSIVATYHPQKGCGYGHVTVLKFCCLLWCKCDSCTTCFIFHDVFEGWWRQSRIITTSWMSSSMKRRNCCVQRLHSTHHSHCTAILSSAPRWYLAEFFLQHNPAVKTGSQQRWPSTSFIVQKNALVLYDATICLPVFTRTT